MIGGYGIDKICPIAEGSCYQITLQEGDGGHLFLLGESTFKNLTTSKDYLLTNIVDDVKELERVKYWLDKKLDLTKALEWAPIFVAKGIGSPLITIDGNNRLMAHFHQYKRIDGVQGYLFTHNNILNWLFIPTGAK